jgi:hypothetical protein
MLLTPGITAPGRSREHGKRRSQTADKRGSRFMLWHVLALVVSSLHTCYRKTRRILPRTEDAIRNHIGTMQSN